MKEALNKNTLVLAVDPGLSGAAVLAGRGDARFFRDFKTPRDITEALRKLIDYHPPDHVIVEMVGARPGQGVVSTFSFGQNTGVALGSLFALRPGQNVERVHPNTWVSWWKKQLGGFKKGQQLDSREVALQLFPQFEVYLKRKKDHNTADALLIGLWKLSHL